MATEEGKDKAWYKVFLQDLADMPAVIKSKLQVWPLVVFRIVWVNGADAWVWEDVAFDPYNKKAALGACQAALRAKRKELGWGHKRLKELHACAATLEDFVPGLKGCTLPASRAFIARHDAEMAAARAGW